MSRKEVPELGKLGQSFLTILLELTSEIRRAANTPELIESTYKASSFISSDIMQVLELSQEDADRVAKYHSLNVVIQNPILYNDSNMVELSIPAWARAEDTSKLMDYYRLIDEISTKESERPEIKKRLQDMARIRSRIVAHYEGLKFPWLYGAGIASSEVERSAATKPKYNSNEPARTHLGKLSTDFDHTLAPEDLERLTEEEKACENYLGEKTLDAAEAIEAQEQEIFSKITFFAGSGMHLRHAGFDRSLTRVYLSIPSFTLFRSSFYSNAETAVAGIAKKLMKFQRLAPAEGTRATT